MRHGFAFSFQSYQRRGITLIDVLASLAIISVMLALFIPALSATRGEARVAQCQSNLKVIAATAGMYSTDNAASPIGGAPTSPWHLGFYPLGHSVNLASEFVYGGYQTAIEAGDIYGADYHLVPTEYRPFNKYIAPGISGKHPLRQYVCPDDTMNYSIYVGGSGGEGPLVDTSYASWEAYGNSYAINWWWVDGASGNYQVYSDIDEFHRYGSAMLSQKVGAAASKFVLFMEHAMNAYLYEAVPPGGSFPHGYTGMGWHGRHSTYSMAMWDGHVEYRFIDTRFTSDYGYELWPEPTTLWPPSE